MSRRLGRLALALALLMTAEILGMAPGSSGSGIGAPAHAASLPPAAVRAADGGLRSFPVRRNDLGIHSNQVKPEASVGALRMNCFPLWREVNPSRGVYTWARMDALVDRAVAWGYRDIVLSFCGTPQWAGGSVRQPEREVLGPGTTAPPRDIADWRAFVTAVVQRYKGRITAYQAWNEPTTTQFFQGSPKRMAKMTKVLKAVVDGNDPDALVVAASLQRFDSATRTWGRKYLKQLRALGWPVDVFSFHGYSATNSLANGRQQVIRDFRRELSSLRAPSRPLWDTEVTYKASSPLSSTVQGALVIRSYLDGWRMGVRRTYWYAWTDTFNDFGAVQMRSGTVPAKALARFSSRVIGSRYRGCTESRSGLVRCRFTKAGKSFTIAWAEGRSVTVRRTRPTRYQNLVTGKWSKSRAIRITGQPLMVKARL